MKRTSNKWLEILNEKVDLIIVDPDGWDGKKYNFSFYEEKISVDEFLNRLIFSTITIRNKIEESFKDILLAKPLYESNTFVDITNVDKLIEEVEWTQRTLTRSECFMSSVPLEYTYGEGNGIRTYHSVDFHPDVKTIMENLNKDGYDCDVCFLNYYKNNKQWLGWHSDDSHEIDQNCGISVVSFGAERYIYVKPIGYKGEIPDENKYLLENGSLFFMPAGFQDKWLHKIPKHHAECGPRISLTFRKFKKS